MNLTIILHGIISTYTNPGVIIGLDFELFFIFLIIFLFRFYPKSKFVIFFDLIFEKVFDFFEELLGKEEKIGPKLYITSLFFIILFSNLFGVFLEFFTPIFGEHQEHFIKIPSSDINFNLAMALISVFIVLFEQMKHLGFTHFLYEYFPIFGKNYIPFERGKLPIYLDIPVWLIVKIFDITISMFLGLLEIVGFLAKIISLSFRLFGNITSGGVLLLMIFTALGGITGSLFSFKFPILIPLLVYAQEIMVAFIQAFVFPLLVAIFIKVGKLH